MFASRPFAERQVALADESNTGPGQKDDDSPNPINERY